MHLRMFQVPQVLAAFARQTARSARNRSQTRIVVLMLAQGLVGCGASSSAPPEPLTVSPTGPSMVPPPPSTVPPVPSPPSTTFEMTGVVTDYDGRPVPGAAITVLLDLYSGPSVVTDAAGRYTLSFTSFSGAAWPGGFRGAPGTEEAVAIVQLEAAGYERYVRYVLGATQHLVENFQPHRIKRITAGESMVLTIAAAPDDTVCVVDVFPGRDWVCGIVRVVVPTDGTMRVEAIPSQAGSEVSMLDVYGGNNGSRGNPTSIQVTAGTEYKIDVGVPWGISGSHSFVVKTSIAVR